MLITVTDVHIKLTNPQEQYFDYDQNSHNKSYFQVL